MDKLKIPLSTHSAKGVTVDAVVSEDELRPEGAKDLSIEPVTVKGQLTEVGGDYLFRGDISGAYRHTCDRCLEETTVPFDLDVTWAFMAGPLEEELSAAEEDLEIDEEPDRARTFENGEIDLAPHVWEEIVLSAPSKYLCREDCAGLCPRCGTNRNREQCDCSPDEAGQFGNKALQRLADMFPDLKKKDSEE